YSAVLIFGLFKIVIFLAAGNVITMEEFLRPSSPGQGNLSFQTALGITIASAAALSLWLIDAKCSWASWTTQLLIVILISMAAFGFAENMGPLTYFRHLISIPASVGWFFFGM